MLLVVVCACVVAAGFFFAARQHFTSMEFGLKNSKLREQLQNLEAEKRRLLLAREVAHSPLAIGKAAREVGLKKTEMTAVLASAKVVTTSTDKAPKLVQATLDSKQAGQRVVVPAVMTTTSTRTKSTGDTRSRVVDTNKEKKEKVEVAALLKLR